MPMIIALLWLVGTCFRIYRQARFYQIEEYMSGRYFRWLLAHRERWLPVRPISAWVASIVFGFLLSEAPGDFILGLIGIISAWVASIDFGFLLSEAPGDFMLGLIGIITTGIAIWPPRESEIKKPLRRTPRVRRMLAAAFALALVVFWLYLALVNTLPFPDMSTTPFIRVSLAGLLLLLTAPVLLMGGNLLMTPVEAYFRQRFIRQAQQTLQAVNPTVIGITGSYGKTSTKAYLTHILNGRFKAYPTPKSYNTLMGVCLAINNDLANDRSIDYFICEMGAYVEGEIKRICDLTQPAIGVVVEVGPQHLERFGSQDNIAKAKYEIIKALPADGVGVFNWDNPFIREMYERGYPQTRLAVSKTLDPQHAPANGPRFIASQISDTLDGMTFTITDRERGQSEQVSTPLLGQHNITNILLAVAIASHEGMSLKDIAWRVSNLQPAESRLVRQTTAQGITLINDAYSANPVGAIEALRVLGMHTQGRRVLITPGMVELGELMESENHKLGATAASYATDVILVGEQQTRPIKTGLLAAGFPPEQLQVVTTLAEAVTWYQQNLHHGDTVLFLNDLPDTYSV